MSFHNEITEGIAAFTAMNNALKPDSRDDYYKWKMESDPAYKAAQAAQEAADRIRAEGGTPPAGAPGPRTFWDRMMRRPMGTRTALNTTAAPTQESGGFATGASPAQSQPGIVNLQGGGGGGFGSTISEDWGANTRYNRGGAIRRFQSGGVADPLADAVNDQLPPPGEEPVPAAVQLQMQIAKEKANRAWEARKEADRARALGQPSPDEGPSPMAFQAIDPLNDQLNRAPPQPPVPGPEAELMHRGELDRINRARQTDQLNRDLPPPEYPPLSPVEQRAIATRGRQEAAQAEEATTTRARAMAGADESVSPFVPEKATSAVGRLTSGILGTKEENDLAKEIMDLYAEKNEIAPGWFSATTPTERKNVRTQQKRIDKEIKKKEDQLAKLKGKRVEPELPDEPDEPDVPVRAVDTGGMRLPGRQQAPVTTTVTPPPQVAQGSGGQPVLPPYDVDPRLGVPNPRTGPAAAGPGGQPPQGGPGQPPPAAPPGTPTAGTTPTGGGQAAAAPPPGAAPRTESADTRTRAFDPTMDRVDPQTGRTMPAMVDAQGKPVPPSPPPHMVAAAQLGADKALAGAAHFGQWIAGDKPGGITALHSGVGAMPANVAQGITQAWSGGGRLNPAQAMTRYMVYQYEALSSRGLTAQANQMAFEVVQRLNLEAAKYADQAVQLAQSGNTSGATTMLMKAHMFTPDGRELALSKDGKRLAVLNEYSNQPIATFPVTPQFILAASLGLRDGSGVWSHLMGRAQMFVQSQKGTDKDAEGRAIRNRNNLLRGRLLEQKLAGGGKGKGTGVDTSEFDRLTLGRTGGGGGNRTTIIKQGSDDGIGPDDAPSVADLEVD